MKDFYKFIFCLFTLPLILCSCNQEDDIYEIFDSGEWTLVNYYSGCDWNNLSGKAGVAKYTKPEELKAINSFKIIFNNDGTLQGKAGISSFTGKWSANPKDRSFIIMDLRAENNDEKNEKVQEFINSLKNASFYQGDSYLMHLAPQSKTTYMQFKHLK